MRLQKKANNTSYLLIIVFFIFSLITGCASSGKSGRGKLSGAMEKASCPRKTEPERTPYRHSKPSSSGSINLDKIFDAVIDDYDHDDTGSNEDATDYKVRSSAADPGEQDDFWGIAVDSSDFMNKDDFHNIVILNFIMGGYLSEYARFELNVGLGDTQIKRTSPLNASMHDHISVLNAGMNMKHFLTPKHTLFGAYLSGGFNYKRIFWRYENPIQPDGEDDLIRHDDLEGVDFYLGAGINLIQLKPGNRYTANGFQLGIEALPTFTVWENETYEGFENDVFGAFRSVKFRVVSTFFF